MLEKPDGKEVAMQLEVTPSMLGRVKIRNFGAWNLFLFFFITILASREC